jgi:arylsulfatase A
MMHRAVFHFAGWKNGFGHQVLWMVILLASCLSPLRMVTCSPRPNFLVILADDLGVETLGCYGGTSYQTPQIDALARTGERFLHCYAMPLCHPTRVALLTGQYPARLGTPAWGTFPEDKQTETFAHVLKQAGYATAVAGKWQLTLLGKNRDHPCRLGFDEYCLFGWHEGPRYYQPLIWQNGKQRDDVHDQYGPDVYCEFLMDFMKRNKDHPFLAYYPMALCHDVTDDLQEPVPYGPGKDRYDTFGEMVEAMDARVGRLVAAVNRLGLRENTLILFLGDNGSPARSMITAQNGKYLRDPVVSRMGDRKVAGGKGGLTDAGTHVPLVANWPGTIPDGITSNDLVDVSDFLPTLAELAGTSLPEGVVLDGRSFARQLLGFRTRHREWVYSQAGRQRWWVRNQRWKLYNDGRLFDLKNDPREKQPVGPGLDIQESIAARRTLQNALESLPQ